MAVPLQLLDIRTCVHWQGNVIATQFHPEKSGAAGLRLMQASH